MVAGTYYSEFGPLGPTEVAMTRAISSSSRTPVNEAIAFAANSCFSTQVSPPLGNIFTHTCAHTHSYAHKRRTSKQWVVLGSDIHKAFQRCLINIGILPVALVDVCFHDLRTVWKTHTDARTRTDTHTNRRTHEQTHTNTSNIVVCSCVFELVFVHTQSIDSSMRTCVL